ncbi:hypothetical protein AX17_003157 [Amanita inopinata Kibby_2008]|nr:hypothetical protein AX17_003157 [Amanita inopinata Kibby_2008]
MDEIIPGLWIGDLPSALDVKYLRTHKIYSILSAMRGRITINETFIRHQISLDDTEDADVLVHLLPSIHFIQAELDKGRGVLVHCQAGISRSATIVAAYIMYTQNSDTESALKLIRKARPNIEPNQNFLQQLEIFHKAHFNISRRDKMTRMFYMERTTQELLNGDGSPPETEMFAKFPRSPSDSSPTTPGGPRRRIRCKMCRQELAAREHMLDHGQLGPPTPAVLTPASSRRPSLNQPTSRRPSITQPRSRVGSTSDARPRRPSMLGFGGLGDTLSMSALDTENAIEDEDIDYTTKASVVGAPYLGAMRRRSSGSKTPPGVLPQISETPKDTNSPDLAAEAEPASAQERGEKSAQNHTNIPLRLSIEDAILLGRSLSDAILSPASDMKLHEHDSCESETVNEKPPRPSLVNASDLAAQLYSNPKLATLRSPAGVTSSPVLPRNHVVSPPILANSKCSGYFVEPMKWMEPFLEAGEIAGKIICPNKKCGAKLGNYDWAGVKCGCKEWVVPGFCINRSKVDEVV